MSTKVDAERSAEPPNAEFLLFTRRHAKAQYDSQILAARGEMGKAEVDEVAYDLDALTYLSEAVDQPETGLWIWTGTLENDDGDPYGEPKASGSWRRPTVDELAQIANGTWADRSIEV